MKGLIEDACAIVNDNDADAQSKREIFGSDILNKFKLLKRETRRYILKKNVVMLVILLVFILAHILYPQYTEYIWGLFDGLVIGFTFYIVSLKPNIEAEIPLSSDMGEVLGNHKDVIFDNIRKTFDNTKNARVKFANTLSILILLLYIAVKIILFVNNKAGS